MKIGFSAKSYAECINCGPGGDLRAKKEGIGSEELFPQRDLARPNGRIDARADGLMMSGLVAIWIHPKGNSQQYYK